MKDCRMDGERRLVYLKTTEARDIGHRYNTVKVVKSIQHILYIIMYNMLFNTPQHNILSMAAACRDAKSCVSRATKAYFHHHWNVRIYWGTLACETQNLASLLLEAAIKYIWKRHIISMAAACRDAKFCVSRAMKANFHSHRNMRIYCGTLACETQDFASLLLEAAV